MSALIVRAHEDVGHPSCTAHGVGGSKGRRCARHAGTATSSSGGREAAAERGTRSPDGLQSAVVALAAFAARTADAANSTDATFPANATFATNATDTTDTTDTPGQAAPLMQEMWWAQARQAARS